MFRGRRLRQQRQLLFNELYLFLATKQRQSSGTASRRGVRCIGTNTQGSFCRWCYFRYIFFLVYRVPSACVLQRLMPRNQAHGAPPNRCTFFALLPLYAYAERTPYEYTTTQQYHSIIVLIVSCLFCLRFGCGLRCSRGS